VKLKKSATEIHKMLQQIYGDRTLSRTEVSEWVEGRCANFALEYIFRSQKIRRSWN
jgi:hypothetical protein